jgi:MFS superfamily sulfate permease-like transporter
VNARSKPNRELAGFGAADIAAGLFQSWAVTGADSRTAVAISSGGRSALVGIFAVLTIAIVAVFLTGPLALLPVTALAAILVSAAIDLFDGKGFVHLARIDRFELLFALVAAAGVIWIGVLEGVIIAVIATFAHLIRLASRPRDGVMGRVPGSGELVTLRRDSRAEQSDRILVYLFEASILFVNADYFGERVRLALRAQPETKWLVLDASAMMHADSSAVETLVGLKASLDRKGITLLLGGGHGRFREILERSGLADLIGPERISLTPRAALSAAEALRDAPPDASFAKQ